MLKELLIVGSVLVVGAASVAAHPGGRGVHRRGERHQSLERIAERLELSPSQLDAVRALREGNRESRRALREQLKAAAVQYRDLRESDDPRATEALSRLRELREELMAERIAARADFEKILTPEQREKIEQRRRDR